MPGNVDPRTDEQLLADWRAGDLLAGKTLVERHHAGVVRFFARKVDTAESDDLTQATFLTVAETFAHFRGNSTFKTWVLGIARNKLLHHLRSRYRDQQRFDPEASSVADLEPSPPSKLDAERRQRLLLEALRRLPVDVQVMLELHYWEKMPIAEIAEVVEKPVNTVKTHMRRGRLRLEELLVELAESPEQLEDTRSGLDGWAERVRRECED